MTTPLAVAPALPAGCIDVEALAKAIAAGKTDAECIAAATPKDMVQPANMEPEGKDEPALPAATPSPDTITRAAKPAVDPKS